MDGPRYVRPTDPVLAQWFDALDDDAREFYQERAGIREFEGGLSRVAAETLAFEDTRRYLQRRRERR